MIYCLPTTINPKPLVYRCLPPNYPILLGSVNQLLVVYLLGFERIRMDHSRNWWP